VRSEVLLTKSRQFSRTFFDGLSNGTIFFHYVTKRHEVASAFKFGLSFLNVMIQQLQAKAINIINTRVINVVHFFVVFILLGHLFKGARSLLTEQKTTPFCLLPRK